MVFNKVFILSYHVACEIALARQQKNICVLNFSNFYLSGSELSRKNKDGSKRVFCLIRHFYSVS